MEIRDCYREIIRGIMAEHGVAKTVIRPNYHIPPDATLTDVLRYADSYVAGSGDDQPHYRYDRYRILLDNLKNRGIRSVVHIDIGCGVGLFSWALLDWARKEGVAFQDVKLYGYDHCLSAIKVCEMMFHRLRKRAYADYPNLTYTHMLAEFEQKLQTSMPGVITDYVITFGYVIAGNHKSTDIDTYSRIIRIVESLRCPESRIWIVASDAFWGESLQNFSTGWESLMNSLILHYTSVLPIGNSVRCVVNPPQEA